jgi:hypothetical protein
MPLDWAHAMKALYRVRCNLFHGEKARTSEDDKRIVTAAYNVLAEVAQHRTMLTRPARLAP